MKVKIIQYFIGNDKNQLNLCQLTKQLNYKYCSLYNYNYLFSFFSEQEIKKYYKEVNIKTSCIYKLNYIYQQLMKKDCEYLIFLDHDAVVSNPNIKIEDLIDNEHQLFLSRSNIRWDAIYSMVNLYNRMTNIFTSKQIVNMPINSFFNDQNCNQCGMLYFQKMIHNEGFYIIKNTQRIRQFFKQVVDVAEIFLDNVLNFAPPQESAILIILNKKQYKDLFTFMYDQAQGTIKSGFEFCYDVDKTFILHNYGAFTIQEKIDSIKQVKTNKWWKPILEKEN